MKYCSVEGCIKFSWGNGKCRDHTNRPIQQKSIREDPCTFSGCQKNQYARGYCEVHYKKMRKMEKAK